jgi:hypothetical protein
MYIIIIIIIIIIPRYLGFIFLKQWHIKQLEVSWYKSKYSSAQFKYYVPTKKQKLDQAGQLTNKSFALNLSGMLGNAIIKFK